MRLHTPHMRLPLSPYIRDMFTNTGVHARRPPRPRPPQHDPRPLQRVLRHGPMHLHRARGLDSRERGVVDCGGGYLCGGEFVCFSGFCGEGEFGGGGGKWVGEEEGVGWEVSLLFPSSGSIGVFGLVGW